MFDLQLLLLALAPGLAICLYIFYQDKHEKEPISLILKCFALGCGSVLLTLAISIPLRSFFTVGGPDILAQFITAFFLVAFVEEYSKFVFVRWVAYPNREFNEPYDAILYAVMVSMGFATLENILYVFEHGVGTGVVRMFTAVPAHATFAVIMGYFLGLQKFSGKKRYGMIGLVGAVLFHGSYNFFLFTSSTLGLTLGALVALLLGVYLSVQAIVRHQDSSPFK